jgi:hypothetical protein
MRSAGPGNCCCRMPGSLLDWAGCCRCRCMIGCVRQHAHSAEGGSRGLTKPRPCPPAPCRYTLLVNFPSAGSNFTPAHPSLTFKWKDYCPLVRYRHALPRPPVRRSHVLAAAGLRLPSIRVA